MHVTGGGDEKCDGNGGWVGYGRERRTTIAAVVDTSDADAHGSANATC